VQNFERHLSAEDRKKFAAAIEDSGRTAAGLRIVPISSNRGQATMLVDAETGKPLNPVEIDPWPVLAAIERDR